MAFKARNGFQREWKDEAQRRDISHGSGGGSVVAETGTGEVEWTVEFTANTADLQNEARNDKAKNIAMESDATLDEALAMRESGMGWGRSPGSSASTPASWGSGTKRASRRARKAKPTRRRSATRPKMEKARARTKNRTRANRIKTSLTNDR